MVERQIARSTPAVLTGVGVAQEDLTTRQLHASARRANQADKPNDRRVGEDILRCGNERIVRFEDFRLTPEDEHNSTSRIANVERFVVLIEDENGFVHAQLLTMDAKLDSPRTRQLSSAARMKYALTSLMVR